VRSPRAFTAPQWGVTDDAACTFQILYTLGLIEADSFFEVTSQIASKADMLEVALRHGAYAHSITPIHPQLVQGEAGEQHLIDALRQLRVPQEAMYAQALLPSTQLAMRSRLEIAKKYKKQYAHDCRVSTAEDIKRALCSNQVICAYSTEVGDHLVVVTPGDGQAECLMFDPYLHGVIPSTYDMVAFFTTRMLTIYSERPIV